MGTARSPKSAVTNSDTILRRPVNDSANEIVGGYNEESSSLNPRQRRRRLIVGGTVAEPGAYGYFVDIGGYCGGSLIAPDVVLTAGHCKPKGKPGEFLVRVGAYQRTQSRHHNHNETAETFEVTKAVRYEKYHRLGDDEFRYDFCLLKLNGQSSHPMISINRNETLPLVNTSVIAMGMGNTDKHHASRPEFLRQVHLDVISNKRCETSKGRGISYHERIDPVSHLCTFSVGKDSCSYDSGGPIISTLGETNLLVALVSWGEECADDIFPGVNARVSGVSEWIDQTVCQWSAAPPKDFHCQGKHLSGAMVNERMDIYSTTNDGTQGLFLGWTVLVSSFLSMWAVIIVRSRRLGSSSSTNSCLLDWCSRSTSRGGNYPYEQLE